MCVCVFNASALNLTILPTFFEFSLKSSSFQTVVFSHTAGRGHIRVYVDCCFPCKYYSKKLLGLLYREVEYTVDFIRFIIHSHSLIFLFIHSELFMKITPCAQILLGVER